MCSQVFCNLTFVGQFLKSPCEKAHQTAGYVGIVILQPRCPQGCEHGSCTSPSTCTCEEVNISILMISIMMISIMIISMMKITHDIIIRVGKEPTAQNEAAQEETGARIVCSSASANMVRLVWHLIPHPDCNFMPLISAHPGATCHPISGNCSCTPGYTGPLCELPCQNKTFGEGCQEKCSCPDGYNCDHVTGGCLRYKLNISYLYRIL